MRPRIKTTLYGIVEVTHILQITRLKEQLKYRLKYKKNKNRQTRFFTTCLTFTDFRTPCYIEAAFVDGFIGFEDDEDDVSGGESVWRTTVTAVTTYAFRGLLLRAVVQGQRVEQARFLLLHAQPHEMYSDYLTTATASRKINYRNKIDLFSPPVPPSPSLLLLLLLLLQLLLLLLLLLLPPLPLRLRLRLRLPLTTTTYDLRLTTYDLRLMTYDYHYHHYHYDLRLTTTTTITTTTTTYDLRLTTYHCHYHYHYHLRLPLPLTTYDLRLRLPLPLPLTTTS